MKDVQHLRSRLQSSRRLRSAALRARFGDLSRIAPLSDWGFERGGPVDRWYIERYLQQCAPWVRGRSLEVQDDVYSTRLGAEQVEVLDIDPTNPRAVVVGDLCAPDTLAPARYDVAVITQTLHLVTDPVSAVRHLLASLRPGGSLLLTAPTLSRLDGDSTDRWRWTPAGLQTLLASAVPADAEVSVVGMGNGLAARAFLFGIGAPELDPDVLAQVDPKYPLVVGARVQVAP
jgi:SAM-dependent methyltransferase